MDCDEWQKMGNELPTLPAITALDTQYRVADATDEATDEREFIRYGAPALCGDASWATRDRDFFTNA